MRKLVFALVAVLSVAAAGCKKKDGGCAAAVEHSMELSRAEMQKMGTDDKTLQKLVDVGTLRCQEDEWSAEALACMTDAPTMTDAQLCYGKLTAEQQAKMTRAATELMAAE